MFNGHLVKVIVGFCGVIILGLISLVFIDSLKEKDNDAKAEAPIVETQAATKTPVDSKTTSTTPTKKPTPTKKSSINKTP
jgi:hypothetical protein